MKEFLKREREVLAAHLPGLDDELAALSLLQLERPESPGLDAFRRHGGPGLLVPTAYGGAGANALDAARIQRAVGARSPSLAVATTMHHFSMASLVLLSDLAIGGLEWMLMEGIARAGKLLASGFAEGRPQSSILEPTMRAIVTQGGVRVSGVKKPCSLARSMDLLTASVLLSDSNRGATEFAIVLVPAGSKGITVSPFWGSSFLAGAESEQLVLDEVFVPEELVVRGKIPIGETMDAVTVAGFTWFEILVTASYLGAASALVERVLRDDQVPAAERSRLFVELEAAMAAVENVARQLPDRATDHGLLVDALVVRYAVQDAIARTVPRAVELLGGRQFMSNDEVGYLAACVNGLGLHPPARSKMSEPLMGYLAGAPLAIA